MPSGSRARAPGLKDRQDRLARPRDALASRPRAGDLAPGLRGEVRELARFRMHLVKHKSALKNRIHSTLINFAAPARSPICSGPRSAAAGAARGRRAVALERQRIDRADRPSRAPDRADQPPAQEALRRPSLRPVAQDRARDPLGARLYDRLGDRRDRQVPEPREAHRLHGPLPARRPIGRSGSPRPLSKHGPTYLRWGTARGDDARFATRPTRSAISA